MILYSGKSLIDKNNVTDIFEIWKIYQSFLNEFIQLMFCINILTSISEINF